MISAKTNIYAVIGDPIAHSLSPVMQNWFIHHFGLDAVYVAFHVKNEDLRSCVDGMRATGLCGLNVTVPHKENVLRFVDAVSDEVRLLGAANTLKNGGGEIHAFVTDPFGFEESVAGNKDRFKGARVLLFGAGGAAKSVALALARLGVKKLLISDLVEQKMHELVALCRDSFSLVDVSPLVADFVDMNDIILDSDIIINATAVGMHPLQDKSVINAFSAISNNHFCYDLVYNPGKTKLLQHAEKAGAEIQNGLNMLIFQGLQSLRIWTCESLPLQPDELATSRKIINEQLGIDEYNTIFDGRRVARAGAEYNYRRNAGRPRVVGRGHCFATQAAATRLWPRRPHEN